VAEASELEMILSVAEQLNGELGTTTAEEVGPLADHTPLELWGPTDLENARLVARLSSNLAQIAGAAASQTGEDLDDLATKGAAAALGWMELVIRGELRKGEETALRKQLPGFVFLVVLPGSGMDRAVELADRTKALLEEAVG
jgi:hypothetical protein